MNEITTVGVDLAKVIAVCAADRAGSIVFTRVFRRDAFAHWAVQLPSCRFGMEACGASHHWACWLASHGHTAQLMTAEFVQPFRKSRAAKNASASPVSVDQAPAVVWVRKVTQVQAALGPTSLLSRHGHRRCHAGAARNHLRFRESP